VILADACRRLLVIVLFLSQRVSVAAQRFGSVLLHDGFLFDDHSE